MDHCVTSTFDKKNVPSNLQHAIFNHRQNSANNNNWKNKGEPSKRWESKA
jgi:hypothetical protein